METKEIFGGSATKIAEAKTETKKTAKKSTAKKELKKEIFIQYSDKQVDEASIVKKITAELKKDKVELKSLKLYFKPEDNACYYVANEKISGRVDLF